MDPYLPYCQTVCVVLLAVAGHLLGRLVAKARWQIWGAAYLIPLVLIVLVAVARWSPNPQLEFSRPFCWLMADRREFALLAFLVPFSLSIPVAKLPRPRERLLVTALAGLVVAHYSLLPFFMPGLCYGYFCNLQNTMQGDVCLQSTCYTCGPAAAVTALRQLGVPAREGDLAILAHTTQSAGTPSDSLCAAINQSCQAQGVHSTLRTFQSVAELKKALPVIAVVKFGFLVDHYVTVLEVTDKTVVVGDPLEGQQSLSHPEFLEKWRRYGIVLEIQNVNGR